MARDKGRRSGPPGATVTGALALLLVVCLVECATEQRINSRGSKPNHIEKVNAWRSQRGASCLSYGHSCWGGHGKRSVKPPATAPDWYLSKLLRRMDANNNVMQRIQRASDDSSGIYLGDAGINLPSTNQLGPDNEDYSLELLAPRPPEAKPMLDDEMLSNYKLWKFMVKRGTSVE